MKFASTKKMGRERNDSRGNPIDGKPYTYGC